MKGMNSMGRMKSMKGGKEELDDEEGGREAEDYIASKERPTTAVTVTHPHSIHRLLSAALIVYARAYL